MEFTPWPKTPRLFRDAVITEKIDGTNAAVVVERHPLGTHGDTLPEGATAVISGGPLPEDDEFVVGAQSRSRLIQPGNDNFAFAQWVLDNAFGLALTLGEGTHYGEWWGHGIQRGYGLAQGDRRFSLFNVHRYVRAIPSHPQDPRPRIPGLGLVPMLDTYTFDTAHVTASLDYLREYGSKAAPGFMRPEGVVVFHSQSRSVFKALIENDHEPKGATQ